MKKIDYWDLADSERLYYTNVNEAVEEILKKFQKEEREIPKVLTLTGFAKMGPDVKGEAACLLDDFLQSLDCNFNYFDDVATEPTERMKKAAVYFKPLKKMKVYGLFDLGHVTVFFKDKLKIDKIFIPVDWDEGEKTK